MNPLLINLTGQRFHGLRVLGFVGFRLGKQNRRKPEWVCLCDCGNTAIVTSEALKTTTTSCGCRNRTWKEKFGQHTKTHGQRHTRAFNSWCAMRHRCYDAHAISYPNYGGRGIKVCERWRNSFQNFLADMGHAPEGMSIERIDNNGDYEPENCKWATRKEQGRNRRSNIILSLNGRSMIASDWARELGMTVSTLLRRLSIGWSAHRTLTTPLRPPNRGTKRFENVSPET